MEFSPNGGVLISGHCSGEVIFWMLETGENVEKLMHKDAVLSLKFTNEGKFMATCDKRGTI